MKALALLLLFLLVSCAQISESIQHALLPPEEEIKLGKAYTPSAIAQNEGLYPDKEVQEYVRRLGNSMAVLAPRKLPYEFYVVNSSVQNAFALPGGPVFVTRGLLLMLENESELASVLGHELGHTNKRHHARYLEKVLGLSLLLNITAIFVADSSASSQLLLQMASVGANLLALKFSRDQEREADDFGVDITVKAGYDPSGFIGVFEKFKRLQKERPPAWLSTHPLPEERIKRVSQVISKYRGMKLKKDSPEFQKVKRKLLSTKKSFELYQEGKKLYSERKKREALRKFKEALRLFPKNQMAHIYSAVILTEMGNPREALKHANEAVSIDPHLMWTWFTRGLVFFSMEKHKESIRDLKEAVKLVPTYADPYYYLGRNYEAVRDYRSALASYERAIKLAKGNEPWLKDAQLRYRRLAGYVR